jgi:hypothetical protein
MHQLASSFFFMPAFQIHLDDEYRYQDFDRYRRYVQQELDVGKVLDNQDNYRRDQQNDIDEKIILIYHFPIIRASLIFVKDNCAALALQIVE